MSKLKLKKVTEKLSDQIYGLFQEIPRFEETQDENVANGLSRDEFRKYCCILEMASKNILISYVISPMTYYILFDGETPVGWFLLKTEKLRNEVLHSGHIGYTISPKKRNMGYGTAGLKLLIQEAKKKGYKQVTVTTDDTNTPSIKMLKTCGFKKFPKNSKIQKITKAHYEGMSQYYLNL